MSSKRKTKAELARESMLASLRDAAGPVAFKDEKKTKKPTQNPIDDPSVNPTVDLTQNTADNSTSNISDHTAIFLTEHQTENMPSTSISETDSKITSVSNENIEKHKADETTSKSENDTANITTDNIEGKTTEQTSDILSVEHQADQQVEQSDKGQKEPVMIPQVEQGTTQPVKKQRKQKDTAPKGKGQKKPAAAAEENGAISFIDISELDEKEREYMLTLLQGAVQKWSEDDSFTDNRKEFLTGRRFYIYPAEEKFFDQLCEETSIPKFRLANAALDYFFCLLATKKSVPRVKFNRKQSDSGRLSRLGLAKVQKVSDGKVISLEVSKAFAENIDQLALETKTKKSLVFNWALNSMIALLFDEKELKEST